jgi:2-polyprenyl-3-methyl-5-hydroxy-6-metoxy-1,4-benzoquinol methylase
MNPDIGQKYDKIAQWWHDQHNESEYGLKQIGRAISYCKTRYFALDVGCGAGGRVTRKLLSEGFEVTGIDASAKMIELAKANHPAIDFQLADICYWQADKKYDFIVAWDSIFHLPLSMHEPVIFKLCAMLKTQGILIYTFGDDYGEHESDWRNDKFYYSTIGINKNLSLIVEANCQCCHLELDQYPQKHVSMIVRKLL